MPDPVGKAPFYWDYDFPVLSACVIKQVAIPMIGIPLLFATLFTGYSAYQGYYEPVLGVYVGAFGFSIFLGLCYLIVVALTGNHLQVGYVITEQGLFSATIGAGRRGASILGTLLLAISDDMTMQGIGLLAQRSDAKFTPWDKVADLRPAGPNKDLKLLNGKGRMIDRLRAGTEEYDRVLHLVTRMIAQRKSEAQAPGQDLLDGMGRRAGTANDQIPMQ
ncbi:hypothetical protein FDK21_00850 [Cohaesibacter sp. CAU 1516]|uniref:hypothetical protein n=1 Tax=Cohaesibacter sp. CAU 1516 TaxID=2576038 RepID=UPI0010FD3178|nr:hypothetical protein [Cohaesibacter sp. CAU 1516]TLP48247.1 hypothetical protein FDK21_00850 [Cohaesibacter sp. CAU 1516]